jgi:dipeptidyl aminopeptidase/acylaminoacyl peptidase
MKTNEKTPSSGSFPRRGQARRLTAGTRIRPSGRPTANGSRSPPRADDDEAQVYLIAPDGGEARRLTSLSTGALALRWFPDSRRIAFVSWVWPDLANDKAQAKRKRERKESKIKAHVTERAEPRYWDHWLADGRVSRIHSPPTS